MNCPKCGKPTAAGAAFCMHCGQMLAGMAPQVATVQASAVYPQAATAVAPDVRRRNTVLACVVSAAILLFAFLGLRAAGVFGLGGKSPDQASLQAHGQELKLNDLAARGSAPDNSLLQARGTGTPPTLGATQVTMPQDIEDWLHHLERCEMKKRAIAKKMEEEARDTISALNPTGGMTVEDVQAWSDPDANTLPVIEKAASIMREMQGPWRDLKQEFDSVPPPAACRAIAEAFDQGLQDIPDRMAELDHMISGLTNPQTQDEGKSARENARELDRQHRRTIDEPFGKTDQLVGKICDKYRKHKWFSIDAHGGNSGILGF